MSSNVVNQVAYLIATRNFPEEIKPLTVELNRTYIDIANAVNNRIIAIFPTNRPARNGENWFFTNQRQEGFRQVYQFTTSSDIQLGFLLSSVSSPSRCWGQFKDAAGNSYGVIWGSNVAIAGQLSFYLRVTGPTFDVITFAVGAGSPVISSGFLVIEWISKT